MKSRMLRQEYFINDKLAECGPIAHLVFLGILGLADREGRLEDRPFPIKVQTIPYYECDINQILNLLFSAGLIIRYEHEDKKYIEIVDFNLHQTIHPKESTSNIPAPKHIAIPRKESIVKNPSGNPISKGISKGISKEGEYEGKPINTPANNPPTPKPKPELEKLGSHFKATKEQIQDLISQDGEQDFQTRVQTLNDYCAATGKTYKDYPAAYRNFRKRDKERITPTPNAPPRNESRYERSQRNARELHEKIMREQNQGIHKEQTSIFLLED